MKTWFWVLALAVLVGLLAGCGSAEPDAVDSGQVAEATQAVTVLPPTGAAGAEAGSAGATAATPTVLPPTTMPTTEPATVPPTVPPTATQTDPPPPTELPTETPTSPPPTTVATEAATEVATETATDPPPLVVQSTGDVQRMAVDEAKALVDAGEAVLYDTRPASSYQANHAAGALSFPESEVASRLGDLPADKALVFY